MHPETGAGPTLPRRGGVGTVPTGRPEGRLEGRLEGRVIGVQVALVTVAALALFAFDRDAVAALVGGGCITAPNAWLALRSRRPVPEGQELAGAVGLFLAMFVKLALTILALALALRSGFGADGPAFFAGVIAALVGHHSVMLLTGSEAVGEGGTTVPSNDFSKDSKDRRQDTDCHRDSQGSADRE